MAPKARAVKASTAFTLGAVAIGLAGCAFFAVQTAPSKVATTERSELALKADALFWQTLHSGDYGGIAKALEATTAAYLKDPSDAVTAAHVGWLHIWKLAESARVEGQSATITDHAVLARRYFQEAVALDPSDARYLGFLASSQLAEGSIHGDEKLTREGYYTLLASIDAWPEFNLFTGGYTMSNQPAHSSRFRQGLDWLWKNVDECVGSKIDRNNPDLSAYMGLATARGRKRVCWNSWIAPHNFEGFFLSMGDMLIKAGDWQTARKVYANARLSPDYASWKFASVLQARIDAAGANVDASAATVVATAETSIAKRASSAFACTRCHER
jgi:cytochrome c553